MHIPPAAESYRDDKFVRTAWFATTEPYAEPAGPGRDAERPHPQVRRTARRRQPRVSNRVGDTNTVIRVDVSPERLELTTFTNRRETAFTPAAVPARKN